MDRNNPSKETITFSLPSLISTLSSIEKGAGILKAPTASTTPLPVTKKKKKDANTISIISKVPTLATSGNSKSKSSVDLFLKNINPDLNDSPQRRVDSPNITSKSQTAHDKTQEFNVRNSYQAAIEKLQRESQEGTNEDGNHDDSEETQQLLSASETQSITSQMSELESLSQLPDHIRKFKQEWERAEANRLRLPLLRQMSPASMRRYQQLPQLSSYDKERLDKIENSMKSKNKEDHQHDMAKLYRSIKVAAHKENRKEMNSGNYLEIQREKFQKELSQIQNVVVKVPPDEGVLEINKSSSAYFDTVEERKRRKHMLKTSTSTFASSFHESNNRKYQPIEVKDIDLGTEAYPFKTDLTVVLGLSEKPEKVERSSPITQSASADYSDYSYSRPSTAIADDPDHELKPLKDQQTVKSQYDDMFKEISTHATELTTNYLKLQNRANKDRFEEDKRVKERSKFLEDWKNGIMDDLHIHVDEAHSRRRRYGNALSLIFFYVKMIAFRIGIKNWKHFVHLKNKWRRRVAAFTLTRVARGMLGRATVRQIKINLQKQREAEELIERQRQVFRSYQAAKIARTWKRYKRRQRNRIKNERRRAATIIQRIIRGVLGRKKARKRKIYVTNCTVGSTLIQSVYRMYKARRRFCLLKKLNFVRRWEEGKLKKAEDIAYAHRINGAAFSIARSYRSYVIRKRLATLLYWNHYEKAMIIQRVYRGHVVRVMFRNMINERERKAAIREKAAIKIQSFFRMKIARKWYDKQMEKKQERLEKRRKRKKRLLKDKKIEVGKYKLNFSKFNRSMRKTLRSMMPFRYVFVRHKATIIQKVWRGHKARRRYLVLQVHKKIGEVIARFEKRNKAAVNIQKTFRGFIYRRKLRKELWRRMATKIQCYWRRRMARRTVWKMQQKNAAFAILDCHLSAMVRGMRVRKHVREGIKLNKFVVKIQRLGRKYNSRKKRRVMKDELRLRAEADASAALTAIRLLTSAQLMILNESLASVIGQKVPTLSNLSCPCFGPIQALFVNSISKKKYLEPELLASNRIDPTSIQKMINTVDEYSKDKDRTSKKNSQPIVEQMLTIFKAKRLSLLHYPKVITTLSSADIDVLFNKYKTQGANVLIYSEFCDFLYGLGNYSLDLGSETGSRGSTPKQLLKRSQSGTEVITMKINQNARQQLKSPGNPNMTMLSQTKRKKQPLALDMKSAVAKYLFPLENLIKKKNVGALAVCCYLLLAVEHESWMKEVVAWLEVEGKARLAVFVTPIQCMIRRKLALARVRRIRQEMADTAKYNRVRNAAVKIQCLVRRWIGRMKAVRVAQVKLVKYIPHKGQTYWHNPVTLISTFTKPKILKAFDCREVPLPPPKLDYVITCSICEIRTASVNCNQCEDSYCKTCFSSQHCKGKRLFHKTSPIPFCSLCKFQMATKACASCSLRKPPRFSAEELIQGDRGLLCDTCYVHIHSKSAKVNTSQFTYDHLTKDAYLVCQELYNRVVTDHRHENLVQICEECTFRSATFRCADCDQVYCNSCLIGMHSIGGPFSTHKAERLPYYTPNMHIKFEKATFDQRLQRRVEKISQAYAKKMHERKLQAVLSIQSWWRMIRGRREGKNYMKEVRLGHRKAWRYRKFETFKYRQTLLYQLKHAVGMTPPLTSDNREEQIVNRFNVLSRQRIRHYIWNNVEDWGYIYAKGSATEEGKAKPPRKGIPKRGFDVGTIDELLDQAARGGYRMPGRLSMKQGETVHNTTMDMTSLLRSGMIVRVGKSFFGIKDVQESTISLNRRWRYPSGDQVVYLVPSRPGEKYYRYYRFRHDLFDWVCGNPVVQQYFEVHKNTMNRISDGCTHVMRWSKRNGFLGSAKKWGDRAKLYTARAEWAKSLMYAEGGPVSIDGMSAVTSNSKTSAATGTVASRGKNGERIPGQMWMMTEEELFIRKREEKNMPREQLAAEAVQWEEKVDPTKNVTYYFNNVTMEKSYAIPGAILAAQELEAEAETKRKQFLEAQKKITRLTNQKNRKQSITVQQKRPRK